jgi:ribosomal protein L11 methylase PrmA
MLRQLRKWIECLEPGGSKRTEWSDYAQTHSYAASERAAKASFVVDLVRERRPPMVWDLGCNTGDFAATALGAGAGYIVGFDTDQGVLEEAFRRSADRGMRFLPLYQNAFNPSPDQGWNQSERLGLRARAKADAVLALAFVHHLAIGRNVPLPRVVEWIISLAPTGVLEFVPKDDPMIRQMLALREDIFETYAQEQFERALRHGARIVKRETVSATGRCLYWFERT